MIENNNRNRHFASGVLLALCLCFVLAIRRNSCKMSSSQSPQNKLGLGKRKLDHGGHLHMKSFQILSILLLVVVFTFVCTVPASADNLYASIRGTVTEQTGFKAYQASGIHLDLDQIYNLPVKLALGAATEQIVVEANPVQVEQTDMQLGTTVTGQTIVDMPLNGRNWTQLQQLQPGIVGTSDRFGGAGGAYSGNGAGTQQNS